MSAPSPSTTPAESGRRILLDVGGRAPVTTRARDAYVAAIADGWADPRRLSSEGRAARHLLDAARESLATSIGARPDELVLTGSHTSALHSVITAVAKGRRRTGRDVTITAIDRSASHAAAEHAAAAPWGTTGSVAVVPVDGSGRVDTDAFAAALTATTAVAVCQLANPEVGTLQPVPTLHGAARAAGVPLVVDAGSAAGHMPLPQDWDALTVNAGDLGAPEPIGIVAVRPSVRRAVDWPDDPDRWYPGGVSVPAAVAAAVAMEDAVAQLEEGVDERRALVDRVREQVPTLITGVDVAGDPTNRLPHVLTLSCLYVDGEAIVTAMDAAGISVGSGSACANDVTEPSHVLRAMGVLTHGNVRLSLPRGVGTAEIDRFITTLVDVVTRVRTQWGADQL